jgi:rare lipoprotein A
MPIRTSVLLPLGFALLLGACSSTPPASSPSGKPAVSPAGKYYLDDGPLKGVTQEMIDAIPEPVPKAEALNKWAKRPYTVMGKTFVPMTEMRSYRARGVATWYGSRYHGRKTAIGETYDMLQLSAAHPTLPLPSYVRVTNLENGKSIVVRVNDRGPFLHDRLIDLSYAAARRLGYANKGSARVEVELLQP